jgi:tetratricopeptide (TPR) repeat protein
MRAAYSGRAAAYEKKGDYAKALADHNMAVLYYALENEIQSELDAPDRDKFLAEAARAYRARARCLDAQGRQEAALADRKRADGMEADAKKQTAQAQKPKEESAGEVRITNAWTDAVTMTVGGVTYRLEAGEKRTVPLAAPSAPYEMQAGSFRQTGTLAAGKAYTIEAPQR